MKTSFSPYLLSLFFQFGFLVCPAMAISETMNLVDQSGASLSAKLVSCDGSQLTLERQPDKKVFSIPLSKLNPASQSMVQKWISEGGNLAEKYQVTVDTKKSGKTAGGDDFDDKRVNLEPTVIIRNPSGTLKTREGKFTVLFLGRPVVHNSFIYVFKKREFELPSLAPFEAKSFAMERITSPYDDKGYSKFGARYLGYVVVIQDTAGSRVLDAATIPTSLLSAGGEAFLKMDEKKAYDKDMKVTLFDVEARSNTKK